MLTMLLIRLPAGSAFMRRKRSRWVWNGEITRAVYSRRSAEDLPSTNWSVRGILHDSDHCGQPGTKEVFSFFSYSTLSVMRVLSFMVAVRAKPLVVGVDMCDCKTISKASRTSSSVTWWRHVQNKTKMWWTYKNKLHFKFSFEQNKCHYYKPSCTLRFIPKHNISISPAQLLSPDTLLSAAGLHTLLYTSKPPGPGVAADTKKLHWYITWRYTGKAKILTFLIKKQISNPAVKPDRPEPQTWEMSVSSSR